MEAKSNLSPAPVKRVSKSGFPSTARSLPHHERPSRIVLVKRSGCQTGRGNRRWTNLTACTAIFAVSQVMADNASTNEPPPFKQLRYDESYAYLRESSRRADWLDPIKFIPLNPNGSSYLTVGGEIRE